MARARLPQLPAFLKRKFDKTGQTRGADDDQVFQNRVSRCSTVLIPFFHWEAASKPPAQSNGFENGFIALISPHQYFEQEATAKVMEAHGLRLGENALVFYETRADWQAHDPLARGWIPAQSRQNPLGGQFVARVPAITALENGGKINLGFEGRPKGAGIRVYEYAPQQTISDCRTQLEGIFWHCADADEIMLTAGMTAATITDRRAMVQAAGRERSLLDLDRMIQARVLAPDRSAMCPLCLAPLSASEFISRIEQGVGREVHDQTVTQVNLFHIKELGIGRFGHSPYNVGWGHHHCNVVVKDSGLDATLIWMNDVVLRNTKAGYIVPKSGPGEGSS